MKIVKLLIGLGTIVLLLSILLLIQKQEKPTSGVRQDAPVVINIQPLDGIENVDGIVKDFVEFYLKPLGLDNYKTNMLSRKATPDSAYNKTRTRYRATKLLGYLHDNTQTGEFTIGITDKDLSTSIHGYDDYGILGISFLGHKKRACITSTYRLKYKKDLWKLMAHEFTHGFFSLGHCKMDDPYCIMQDAKGKSPRFESKEYLCSQCVYEIDRKLNPSF